MHAPGLPPQRPRRRPPHRPHRWGRLPVDAPDVPRQRLVLHLGRHGRRRHARVPACARSGAHLGAARGGGRHPHVQRADGADRRRPSRRRAPAGAHRDRRDGRRAALAHPARPPARAGLPPDPPLRAHRDLHADHELRRAARLVRPGRGRAVAAARAPGSQPPARGPGPGGGRADGGRAPGRRDARRGRGPRQHGDARLLRATRRPPRRRSAEAGSTPATWPSGTPTGTSSCATASRTW